MAVSDVPLAPSEGVDTPGEDRILTLPNVISLIRLLCMPVFLYLLLGKDDALSASVLLGALGATDWIDGYIARHYHQVSKLGKVLDPVADRLLFFVGIGGILVYGAVPTWFAVMILVREVVVAITTVVLGAMGARRVDVTWFGKAGTFCLMVAFPMFLASEAAFSLADAARLLAWGFGIPGLILSYWSWAMYLPLGLKALEQGRADREAAEAAVS
ncbi:MAG: phosphatidylglycerophosphate synthase [Ilumatobacteraceae bacterium]|nr:phosphatidylglycerophosphate synthase [Ilumatobacteraceae bacterium]